MADDDDQYNASYDEQVAAEVDRFVGNFLYHADSLQLSTVLSSEFASSLRVSTLRSIIINGSALGCRLNDDQIGSFSHCIIKSNILLEYLSLQYHKITDAGLSAICSTLLYGVSPAEDPQQSMRLEGLDLEGNEITAKGLHALRLHSNECSLMSLTLSYNPLDQEGGMIIAEALSSNRILRQLVVNNCGFTLNAIIAIATSIGKLSKMGRSVLEEIAIDRPYLDKCIGEDAIDHFSRLYANTNTSLAATSLKFYACGDLGAKLLAQALCRSSTMVSLNLECNKIGVAGAEALASYLIYQADKGAPSLRSLRLSYNCIGDEGAISLAEAVSKSPTLLDLSLKNNDIRVAGLTAIGNSLFQNNTLESLALFGNDFDSPCGKLFADVIEQRLPYTGLVLDVLIYEVDGIYMVAESNSGLQI